MKHTSNSSVAQLSELLLQRYKHIIGDQHGPDLTVEQIVERIISYYESIISCMPGNVYWLETTGHGIGCNKNVLDMFGFSSMSQFTGMSFEEMGQTGHWDPRTTQSFKNDTLEVVTTKKPKLHVQEPPIPHVDGGQIFFLTNRVPLFDDKNNVIGVVGISTDVTELKNTQNELKEAKEQAEAASQAKSEFLENMSHDVKTPLAGIIGTSELLSYRLEGDNRELAETLLLSGRQLFTFIENCLEVAKLENRNIPLPPEHFQFRAVLEEIAQLFLPAVKTKGLSFTVDYDDNIPDYLLGSRAGTYRVLLNLVGNAVKFTSSGHISIRAKLNKRPNDREAIVTLTVEDTGIGIPKDKQKKIFERFSRLTPSYKGTFEGSGIGLYIVQKFVNSMHGEIYIESEEGKGSQFKVVIPYMIPLLNNEENIDTTHSTIFRYESNKRDIPANDMLNNESAKLVLLVEDNLIAQRMESTLLESINCQVDIVDSGENAIKSCETNHYDIIFLDIGLPGMQGDEVAKALRKLEGDSHQHTPIIALTAHVSDDAREKYLESGMNDVYSKPLSREQAIHILNKYCSD